MKKKIAVLLIVGIVIILFSISFISRYTLKASERAFIPTNVRENMTLLNDYLKNIDGNDIQTSVNQGLNDPMVRVPGRFAFKPTPTVNTKSIVRQDGKEPIYDANNGQYAFYDNLTYGDNYDNYVYATNMGKKNGKNIDVMYRVIDVPQLGNGFSHLHITAGRGANNTIFRIQYGGSTPTIMIEYYNNIGLDASNKPQIGEKISIDSATFTFNNVDNAENFNFSPLDEVGGRTPNLYQIYTTPTTSLYFVKQPLPLIDNITIGGLDPSSTETNPNIIFTATYDNFSSMKAEFYNGNSGSIIYPGEYELNNLLYDLDPPSLLVSTDDFDLEDEYALTYEMVQIIPSRVTQGVSNRDLEKKALSDFEMVLDLSQYKKYFHQVEASNISIVDLDGNDFTNKFSITRNDNKIIAKALRPQDLTSETLTMSVGFALNSEQIHDGYFFPKYYDESEKVFKIPAKSATNYTDKAIPNDNHVLDSNDTIGVIPFEEKKLTISFVDTNDNAELASEVSMTTYPGMKVNLAKETEVVTTDKKIREKSYIIDETKSIDYKKEIIVGNNGGAITYYYEKLDSPLFCFKLERTKEKLTVVDPNFHDKFKNQYKSIEVQVPIHVSMDSSVATPTGWEKMTGKTEEASQTYQYNMKSKNDKQSISDFMTSLKFTISDPIDKAGDVVITLREDELLKNTPPKTKAITTKSLQASVVIETNDIRLSADNKWDDISEKSFVELNWDSVANLTNTGYRLYQSSDGINWNTRSTSYNKKINVLNLYPDRPESNVLESWMDDLGLVDGNNQDLISVTPVSIADFNSDPSMYLLDSNTDNYIYDVIMVGSYDGNANIAFNDEAISQLETFSDLGRGILFGHDTVTGFFPTLAEAFANKLGLGYGKVEPQAQDVKVPEGSLWVGSRSVEVVNDGYMMKFPFELFDKQVLTIPYTHNIEMQNLNIGTTWLEFIDPSSIYGNPVINKVGTDGQTYRNGWYLKTNGNVGMIQTGHMVGLEEVTIDEKRIIANTLYNLAQVSLENNGQDYSVKDDVSPEVSKVTRNKDNEVSIDGEDYGKDYQFYVTADTKDKGELKSDVVETTVISDMQGYIYKIDNSPTTVPTAQKDAYGKVTNINAPVVNPDVSRVATISGATDENEWLHVVPVDRANNVGKEIHIQLKDIDFEEDPESIYCKGTIPQKVYIKGKDDQGNVLSDGDQVLETALRVGKKVSFTPTTIEWYTYENLQKLDGTLISPEEFTIGGTKQDAEAIYTRSLTEVHVRQVILSPSKNLVEPLQGEGLIQNTDTLGGASQAELPIDFPTRDSALAGYKTLTYAVNTAEPYYMLQPILPEYYQYDGYVLTTSNQVHNNGAKVTGLPKWDITANPEVWVTLYLSPNSSGGANPGLYGWGYGKNGTYQLVP